MSQPFFDVNILSAGIAVAGKQSNYKIVRPLGQGGFGITYLVTTRIVYGGIPTKAEFALKEHFISSLCQRDRNSHNVVFSEPVAEEVNSSLQSFLKEAKRLEKIGLVHPNIVKVSEVFEANNTAYYVMEYLDGPTLYDYVVSRGKLTESEAAEIIHPIAHAVKTMHKNYLAHYDIKPDNIIIVHDDKGGLRPVLIDFGLAKHYNDAGKATSRRTHTDGYSCGYSPIEQYSGIRSFSPCSDIYSLACTMFFCLTGYPPAEAFTIPADTLDEDLGDLVSARTLDALRHAMALRVADRTPDAAAFISEMWGVVDENKIDNIVSPNLRHDDLTEDPSRCLYKSEIETNHPDSDADVKQNVEDIGIINNENGISRNIVAEAGHKDSSANLKPDYSPEKKYGVDTLSNYTALTPSTTANLEKTKVLKPVRRTKSWMYIFLGLCTAAVTALILILALDYREDQKNELGNKAIAKVPISATDLVETTGGNDEPQSADQQPESSNLNISLPADNASPQLEPASEEQKTHIVTDLQEQSVSISSTDSQTTSLDNLDFGHRKASNLDLLTNNGNNYVCFSVNEWRALPTKEKRNYKKIGIVIANGSIAPFYLELRFSNYEMRWDKAVAEFGENNLPNTAECKAIVNEYPQIIRTLVAYGGYEPEGMSFWGQSKQSNTANTFGSQYSVMYKDALLYVWLIGRVPKTVL